MDVLKRGLSNVEVDRRQSIHYVGRYRLMGIGYIDDHLSHGVKSSLRATVPIHHRLELGRDGDIRQAEDVAMQYEQSSVILVSIVSLPYDTRCTAYTGGKLTE